MYDTTDIVMFIIGFFVGVFRKEVAKYYKLIINNYKKNQKNPDEIKKEN